MVELISGGAMVISCNDNIKLGNSTFHIQTEYYKASDSIICNIFKDGKALKKLRKPVKNRNSINDEICSFHEFVLNRLKEGAKLKEAKESKGFKFYFPEDLKVKIVDVISPYFGAALNVIWNDTIKRSKDIESFVSNLLADVEKNMRVAVEYKVRHIISNFLEFKRGKDQSIEGVERDRVLIAIYPFFEQNANSILDLAQSLYGGDVTKFKDIVLRKFEGSEENKKKLKQKLDSLFS